MPIPEEMRSGRDDVLYMSQRWPNRVIMGRYPLRGGDDIVDVTFLPFLEHDWRDL
ncbi:hypothetical protein QJS66_21555 [Kocuria rhizophila]|nr:hypothetical protein QJS66_21555 [Kocuria rhizophila]